MTEGGYGWFTRRIKKDGKLSEETFVLPNITEIDFTIGAQLTELPTIIYGAENNFVMDLGTYKQYEIQVERVTPNNYDDSSKLPEKWSNGKWYQELEKFWDFWQNLTYNKDGTVHGGLGFCFKSADTSLYPDVSTNVFLTGSMSPSFSVQRLVVRMMLLVARTDRSDDEPIDLIDVIFDVNGHTYTQSYPEGVQMGLDYVSSDLTAYLPQDGSIFNGWRYNKDGIVYDVGTIFTVEEGMKFTAEWTAPKYAEAYLAPGEYSTVVPTGISRIVAYIVGGGGSGGKYYFRGGTQPVYAGGGGGSGQVTVHEFRNLTAGQTINITVGSGGLYEEDGEASCVDIGYNPVYAYGGLKGANASEGAVAAGGAQYNKGGSSTNKTDGTGEDGAATDGLGIAGKGAATLSERYMGGGGGGAADLNCTLAVTNTIAGGELSKDDENIGWWTWATVLEEKINCEASCTGITGKIGHVRLKCTPTSNGFFMYRVVLCDQLGTRPRKEFTFAGIKADSDGAKISETFQSKGGDSSAYLNQVEMGRLGGGGSSSSYYDPSGNNWLQGMVPGGAGCVILAYVE